MIKLTTQILTLSILQWASTHYVIEHFKNFYEILPY